MQEKIDGAVGAGIKKVWHGMLAVAASGFGKGLLIAAGLAAAGAMLTFGAGAAAGAITDSLTGVPITVDTAVKGGLSWAANFLTSPLGLVYMGAGGAMGAVADAKKHQGRITEHVAKEEAARLAKERESAISKPLSIQRAEESRTHIQKDSPRQSTHTTTHSYIREGEIESKHPQPTNGRAAKSVANAFAAGDIEIDNDPGGFVEREEQRRMAREIRGRAT